MESQGSIEELTRLIEPVVQEAGFELVDITVVKSRFKPTLKLLADRKEGGITVGECTVLNRRIGDLLDAQNIFSQGYILEVSSPGIDRPLSTQKDFLRSIGKSVRFFLQEPVEGKLEWMGVVTDINEHAVAVDCQGKTIAISLSRINKARQEF